MTAVGRHAQEEPSTEQQISGKTVHVRVPDLAEHVMRIKVHVTDATGLHLCLSPL